MPLAGGPILRPRVAASLRGDRGGLADSAVEAIVPGWIRPVPPSGALQRLAAGVSGVQVVPVGDLGLAFFPAKENLATLTQTGKIHQPPVQVAHDDTLIVEVAKDVLPFELAADVTVQCGTAQVKAQRELPGDLAVKPVDGLAKFSQSGQGLLDPGQQGLGLGDGVVTIEPKAHDLRGLRRAGLRGGGRVEFLANRLVVGLDLEGALPGPTGFVESSERGEDVAQMFVQGGVRFLHVL